MHDDSHAEKRERRTAWFIAAVMLAATIYMVSQGGLLNGLIDFDTEEAPVASFADRSGQYRRGVTLPLNFVENERVVRRRSYEQLRSNAINWVEIPFPIWRATSRQLEYSSFDLDAVADLVRELKRESFGVTLLPLHWDGDTLSPSPRGKTASSFLQTYRVLLLDLADLASTSGADALLLDGLFGDPTVSATEWLSLIGDLRGKYRGSMEIRLDEDATPLLYLKHFDGAHISPDSLRLLALRDESPDTPIYLRNALRDRYTAGILPWQPHFTGQHHDPDAILHVLQIAERNALNGYTLCCRYAWENLIVDRTALGALLLRQRERSQQRQLEGRRQQFETKNP
jgi:hypothetical protein